VSDSRSFIKLNRLINFELDDFQKQINDAVKKYVKGIILNIPSEHGIPVLQIERKILEINDLISGHLKSRLENDFGVNLKNFDLAVIDVNKESYGYAELRKITSEVTAKTTIAQADINIKNMAEMQGINSVNMEETLRIQREEAQRAQKLQTETNFIGAHALNQQADVLKTGAENLGNMGTMELGGAVGGMNPAGMMTGMMIGGAMGNQMAGMMNQMGQNMNQQQNTPPPPPQIQYSVSVNGQTAGPFNWQQLQQMVHNGQLNQSTYVWKQGMAGWEFAGNVQELDNLFGTVPPPPPPVV
jgi:hypothetical protein